MNRLADWLTAHPLALVPAVGLIGGGIPRQGLTMAADWAVSYHRSKLHGKRVYYFRHSAIEYVFQ